MEQGILKLSLDKGTSSRKVMEAYQGREYLVYVKKKKRGGLNVRKDLVLMYGEVLMEKCVQELSMEGSCV